MKVISVNTNGIRAAERKGFFGWLQKQKADVVCIQETKAAIAQLKARDFFPVGHHVYYNDAQKAGYSGVAVYSRVRPDQVRYGLGHPVFD
ncbi:MAG: endonuclease/exonuclease/phosphatase family protein, partial [Pseudomonadota bacterium]